MEWIGKVNATGTYDLFVPCANCNDGAPCQTEAFRMSEFLNLAYHPGCLGCQEKGIPCPDNSHTGGALWTLGTSDEPPRAGPSVKDFTNSKTQNSAGHQQNEIKVMDEGWEDGEANKATVAIQDDSSTAPSADDLDVIIRRGLDSHCQAMRRYLDLSEDLKSGTSPTLVIDRLMNGLQTDCRDDVQMWELVNDMKRRE